LLFIKNKMEQVKTFDHNQHDILDNLVNEFLKEINSKGYDLLEIYYNSVWNHNQSYAEHSAMVLFDNKE
jgi:Sporulation protein Cse60